MVFLTSLLKQVLLLLCPIGHISIAVAAWFSLRWSMRLWKTSTGIATIILPVLLVTISYDNFVLGAGRFIGEGDALKTLSIIRYFVHDLIVPFFIVVGVEIAHEAGAKWANKGVRILSWIVAVGVAIATILQNDIGLELELSSFAGVLHYTATNVTALPWVPIAVNGFMLLIAIGVWIRLKWSWLFAGTLIAVIANAIPTAIVGTLPSSLATLLMALSLLLTEKRIQDRQNPPKPSPLDNLLDFEWEYELPKEGYTIYQAGSHIDGDFIQVYVPHTPHQADGKLKLITYLHGFALCLPKFYETHLAYLAGQKGYYVFFPDFQNSRYPDDPSVSTASIDQSQDEAPLTAWFQVLRQTLSNPDEWSIREILAKVRSRRRTLLRMITRRLFRPTLAKYARLSMSLMVTILVIRVISFVIDRRYGENLIQLISTVGLSLVHSPKEWGNQAIDLTDIAWQKLGQDNGDLAQAEFDFYVFGHSLGGLLALSWPFFLNADQQRFNPQQILTADPSPSTELGIPRTVMLMLKLFNVPFAEDPVTIEETGMKLADIPVGIMHGASDKMVKPQAWVKPGLFSNSTNYDYIPKGKKQIYFSQSNREKELVAFHNQAVTDTTYFENALFKKFGGVKEEPNAYNYNYVWRGLDLIVHNDKQADDLLTSFQNPDFQVLETFTVGAPWLQRWVVAIAAIATTALIYWLFSIGNLFT